MTRPFLVRVRTDNWLQLLKCRKGNVAIEFGFMVPIFVLVTLAAVELGRLGSEMSRITHAAKAGTQYGIQDQSNANDISGIIQAVRDNAEDANNELTVSARRYCRCPGQSVDLPCTDSCTDDKFAPMFVEVNVSHDLAAVFDYLKLPVTYPLAVRSTSRVR